MSTSPVPEETTVRISRPEDDGVVGELLVDSFVTTYAKKAPGLDVTEERRRELRSTSRRRTTAHVLVSERSGRLTGTVTLYPPGAPDSRAWRHGFVDLRYLATHPATHGSGSSGPLLDEAERWTRNSGAAGISLHVRKGVKGVARLYLRRGYVRAPDGDRSLSPSVLLEGYVLAFS